MYTTLPMTTTTTKMPMTLIREVKMILRKGKMTQKAIRMMVNYMEIMKFELPRHEPQWYLMLNWPDQVIAT